MTETAAPEPNSYDVVIYPSRAMYYTHPATMVTLAHLLGLTPAPPEQGRVLELGAGTGGNLIPMAAHLPDARFVGYDLSARQVAQGNKVIGMLGLDNITLEQADLMDLGPELGEFDFIICHGVFSWVGPEVQRQILALCRAHLAPHGLAAVSYNTLPGSAVRSTFHRLLRLRDDESLPVPERIAGAVESLRDLRRELLERKDPRSLWLSAELTAFNQMDQSYFFHEYLEPINEPLYFSDFMAQVHAADLRYLGNLHTKASHDAHWPRGEPIPSEEEVLREQAELDIVRWRRFRCTLLGRPELQPDRAVAPERLYELSFAMRLDEEELTVDMDADGPMTIIDKDNHPHFLRHGLEDVARSLLDASPAALSFDTLFELLPEQAESGPWTRERLAERLLELYFASAVQLHGRRPTVRKTVSERPRVHALTRLEAQVDEWATNAWHHRVKLGTLHRVLVQFLDGEHTLADLEDLVRARFASGDLAMKPRGAPIENVVAIIPDILEELGRLALLVD